ncbi:FtsX-like permease family protein [Embleya sp. NPDC050493]|uniref:FtsX-like permease family protein n=1 Tax=Embleya sp. NPDC050493 TaxID=3363989 RepID=UPI00379F7C25
MGVGFAVTGGREGWTRTLLTAIGVGLGVALLLLTTAIPGALGARDDRGRERDELSGRARQAAPNTLLVGMADTTFKGDEIRGRVLRPEGPRAPIPPGLSRLPAPGEMMVSPALADLLASKRGALLKERLPYRTAGRIADRGLIGPDDLAYYLGSDALSGESSSVVRITAFGNDFPAEKLDPRLLLLVVVMFVVLLMPVAVLIATAVRFGGERRDRRLAALRLVGADARTTRWIAAGEALAGSLFGLLLGLGFFLVGRQMTDVAAAFDLSIFPGDLDPSVPLVVLVALAVPVSAVAVTLFALRTVVIEPLGVVRTGTPTRRRVWWRLSLPVVGVALLFPMIRRGADAGEFNQAQVIGGTVFLLVGVTALLPWLVEALVTRLGGGRVPWQLAVRRLQLGSGVAARSVNGIAVAVAGAIALQMLFTGIENDYVKETGQDPGRAQMSVSSDGQVGGERVTEITDRVRQTKGVRSAFGHAGTRIGDRADDPTEGTSLTIGTCDALRELARIERCADGDTFIIEERGPDPTGAMKPTPGRQVVIDPSYGMSMGSAPARTPWVIPATAPTVPGRTDASGMSYDGVLATPGAVPVAATRRLTYSLDVRIDPTVRDVRDLVRNTAARVDPLSTVYDLASTRESRRFANVRTALFIGTAVVLLLIGASLLVTMLEQLRERRKLLSVLVAFGTRRSTLSWSILYQTAIPVGLGLLLAAATGVGLGAALLGMAGRPFAVDWSGIASMTGIGAGVVLLVTALSLPPLWRLMRPDGLRTE